MKSYYIGEKWEPFVGKEVWVVYAARNSIDGSWGHCTAPGILEYVHPNGYARVSSYGEVIHCVVEQLSDPSRRKS